MSISMKSSKLQMYSEIERLRLHSDQLTQQLRAKHEEATLLRDQVHTFEALRQARVARAINRPNDDDRKALREFTNRYCTKFGVRTVPGHIVEEFKRRQANDQG